MCRFVPGEVVAFGHFKDLNPLQEANLPGRLTIAPLITEAGQPTPSGPFVGIQSAVLKTDLGLELHALSKMAAAVSSSIQKGTVHVDLNHYLPWAGTEPDLAEPQAALRLSMRAEGLANSLRPKLRAASVAWGPLFRPTVAVLDTGLDDVLLSTRREYRYFDYCASGQLTADVLPRDPTGHGTRVIKVLDEILPEDVPLVVGRLPATHEELTVLTVARAFADVIARSSPNVINLSMAPRDDVLICHRCRKPVAAPTFVPTALHALFRISSTTTFTVMAAGNARQVPNTRWIQDGNDGLVLAVAENSKGERASYSGAPQGPDADRWASWAFGGDGPDDGGAWPTFEGDPQSFGTSFAAPFVTCLAVASLTNSGKNEWHVDREKVLGRAALRV